MKCPFCGDLDDRVLDTRIQRDGEVIRRRRECLRCESRFTTVESILKVLPLIVKKDGRLEEFSKAKVLSSVQAACQKRPVSLAQMEQIVESIVQSVSELGEKEVATEWIGQKVMLALKNLDDVAYVRFASVYRTFQDVQEFVSSLDSVTQQIEPKGTLSTTDH